MNFSEIKSELNIESLSLNKSNKWSDDNAETQWFSALLKDKVVSVHAETAQAIAENPDANLGLKSMGHKESSKGFKYELLILVKYKPANYDLVLS